MGGPTSPIDIATPTGNAATSPASQNKTSNLTSALQGAVPDISGAVGAMSIGQEPANAFDSNVHIKSSRGDSFSGGMSGMASQWGGSGAKPISMKSSNREDRDKPRRESLAGSLVGGMSWGGVSVGSWIRDDIIMAGTSPFTYQSPSFHSSSYLPKLEANFMRDFSCCGVTLPSLHDLLQHYEESHAQQVPPNMQRPPPAGQPSQPNATPNTKAAIAAGAAASVQQQAHQQQQSQQGSGSPIQNVSAQQNASASASTSPMSGFGMMRQPPQNATAGFHKTPLQTVQDMDTVEDMEMDDDVMGTVEETNTPVYQQAQQGQSTQQLPLGQRHQRTMAPSMPSLSLATSNFSSPLQARQGLRTSQPSTPLSANHQVNPFQNNPTVSSVNTPTLTTPSLQQQLQQQHLQQQQNTFSPDSSVPGTPAEMEADMLGNLDAGVPMPANFGNMQGFGGFGGGNDMLDLCIDEPAKRLFSPNGFNNQQYAQFRLGGGQFPNEGELGRRLKEQQMPNNMMSGEEVKPFRCPVVGCEKAYKNQNGLKYHKTHGHTNQQLHENTDGTFSIVNPETSVPYPGTLGMEKEKPYRCEVCGKRYKNLNGLKYHKAHSPPCNPDLKLGGGTAKPAPPVTSTVGVPAMGVNVAGAGLAGIGEEGAIH